MKSLKQELDLIYLIAICRLEEDLPKQFPTLHSMRMVANRFKWQDILESSPNSIIGHRGKVREGFVGLYYFNYPTISDQFREWYYSSFLYWKITRKAHMLYRKLFPYKTGGFS